MGCDIHLFAERYNGEIWELIAPPMDSVPWRFDEFTARWKVWSIFIKPVEGKLTVWGEDDDQYGREYLTPWYDCRNYRLFARLAAVRGNEPAICLPRGVPDDSSHEYKDEVDRWAGDGHSHSWYTVGEVDEGFPDRDICSMFSAMIDELREFDPDPEKLRIVFFFDN